MNLNKYRNISFDTRKCCQICGTKVSTPLLAMPNFPLTEIYVENKQKDCMGIVDQNFYFCVHCGHGQILNVIDVELQYGNSDGYFFRTSESMTGQLTTTFFIDFLNKVLGKRHFKTIVELGCNDLYLLKQLKTKADKLVGIDPILKSNEKQFTEDNVFAIGDFFENVNLDSKAEVVICKDTLEHISMPKEFVQKVVDTGDENTVFFFQFPLLEALLMDCRFDQVYHQHLNYFSLKSIDYMLKDLDCELIDYTINYNHWGSIIIAFKKSNNKSKQENKFWNITNQDILDRFAVFKQDLENTSKRLDYFGNEVLYGYGAALMLPVLSYYLKNDLSCLECIIDENKDKDGLFYINLPVPIKHISKIANLSESVVLLTAPFSRMNTKKIMTNLISVNPKYIIYPLKTI